MKILILDNYDSFTYNLMHLVEKQCGEVPVVKKNDQISCAEVAAFSAIILSPGPGLPSEAGIMPEVLSEYRRSIPILGVCLGMQAIAENFGAKLINLPGVFHGVASEIEITEKNPLFLNCPPKFSVGRYHSWVIDEKSLPPELIVTARDEAGNIMAVSHSTLNIHGVQFHPESILSEYGSTIIGNWLAVIK